MPSGRELPVLTGESCVSRVPLFGRLTPTQQAEVAGYARPALVDRGQPVVSEGQPAAELFVVHEGQVKISKGSAEGRETILRVLGPGDVFGEVWFLTGRRPDVDAVALEASRVCVFDHARLAELLGRFPDIGVVMLRTLAERLGSAERMLAARTLSDAGARVAAYLLDLPATFSDGRATVALPLAKKDVATYLGTSPETLSRRLASFEHQGLIRLRGAEIDILDASRLDLRSRGA